MDKLDVGNYQVNSQPDDGVWRTEIDAVYKMADSSTQEQVTFC